LAGKSLSTISEKERWWAALSYIFSPLLPAALIFILDLDEYSFLKQHIYQAIVMGLFFLFTMPIILTSTLCVGVIFWFIMPYWAFQAFNGQKITIPWVSSWVKSMGWSQE
jgi:hypothetical protein